MVLPLLLTLLAACTSGKIVLSDDTGTPPPDDGGWPDIDGDGVTTTDGDCDDADAAVYPGAQEACDGVDNDCDGALDEEGVTWWYTDADADGFGDPAAGQLGCSSDLGVSNADDCDDADADTSPAAAEACDGLDNDCDGAVDDGVTSVWYIDYDRDGHGSAAYVAEACSAPAGYVASSDDCDDASASAYPGAPEVCDGNDDDCDGTADEPDAVDAPTWHADADADGHGSAASAVVACDAPAGHVASSDDCDDADADVYPDAPEACSAGADLDCDGALPRTCASCAEHLSDAGAVDDGLYTIDPDGTGALADVEVWCDMTTDGGGWTLVQRTVWDWADTRILETGYGTWYGASLGDPDEGNAWRLAGAAWAYLDTAAELMAVHHARDASSGADCDPLYYTATGASFTSTSSSTVVATPSSSVILVNNNQLATADGGYGRVCVNNYDAVPWFYGGCCTTCPSFAGGYWSDSAHPMASYLDSTADLYGQTAADVCPSGSATSSYGYEGVNSMSFFVR